MIKVPQQQIPGVYHRRVGDIVVTALSDGFLDGSIDVLRNISPDEARQILTDNFRPARRTAVNAFLIYSAGRLALMETGSGNYLLPTAGKLLANLQGRRRRSGRHRDRAAHPHASRPFGGPHRHGDGQAQLPQRRAGRARERAASTGSTTPRWRARPSGQRSSISRRRASRRRPTRTAGGCSSRARCSPASPPSRAPVTRPAIPPS